MKKIFIVDYGLGNIFSIIQAIKHFGYDVKVTSSHKDIENADYVILPGVGAFSTAIQKLQDLGLTDAIFRYLDYEKPLMGICLGMQILFDQSEENGVSDGLKIISGNVIKFPETVNDFKMKIPHMGWTEINFDQNRIEKTPLLDIPQNSLMYFVHSYYVLPENETNILCTSQYNGFEFCTGIQKNNIFGFQFHPEKSGETGINIYKNFINL